MKTGCDYSRHDTVWGLTLQSEICFTWALVPAKPTFWVCCLWNELGGGLLWSKAGHQECWFWALLGGLPAGPGQPLPIPSLEPPGKSYTVICWW